MDKHTKPSSVSKTKRVITFKKSPAKCTKLATSLTKLPTPLATLDQRMSTRTTPSKSHIQISTNEGCKQEVANKRKRATASDHGQATLVAQRGLDHRPLEIG